MSWHSGMAEKIERAKKTARLSILFVLVAYNDSLSRTSIDSRRRILINRLVNLMNAREKRKSKKGEKKEARSFEEWAGKDDKLSTRWCNKHRIQVVTCCSVCDTSIYHRAFSTSSALCVGSSKWLQVERW